MNEKYQCLYQDMLQDIARCEEREAEDGKYVTSCFWIAHNYWERLKKLIDPNKFRSEADEIEFFRNVKPQFTSLIEYYIILSEGILCVPTSIPGAIEYWKDYEAKRFKRFCDKNESFVEYYESGKRYNDSLFFLRRNAGASYPKSPVYDVDPEYCSSHDHLVRSYLAHKKYWEYCKKRLEALAGPSLNKK